MLTVAPVLDPAAVLRARLGGFVGFLRANGFGVGAADPVHALAVAAHTGVLQRDVLRWSLKALLCGRADEWRRFDALFDAWFMPPNRTAFTEVEMPGVQAPGGVPGEAGEPAPAAGGGGAADDRAGLRHGASRDEALAHRDVGTLAGAQGAYALEALMRRFARRLARLRLRRDAPSPHGRRLDMRRTLRRSVSAGGTPLRLAWQDRRRVRPRLVLLLDASRSMSPYSLFWLRLARALCGELADVHPFVFHTRLAAVGEALREPDPWRAQERLHLLAAGWDGGTRIGDCLAAFRLRHAPRLVHARTAIVIVSDGYDTGEPEPLAEALAALRRRARRLVWLNPLLNQPGWRPESRAMQAALPHLDLLAAGADLAEVERVLPRIVEALR
jgi:uncharacterized protein with von Willebrand factor type A (vWA) domain